MDKRISTPQSPKLSVTPTAENLVNTALEKVNEGFLGGKISKLELTSWALVDSLENLTDAKIEKIRKCFFNEICYLESLVKVIRQGGQDKLTPEQTATLQNVLGMKAKKSKDDSSITQGP